jgi:peptidoglycan/xylan/chitin deacetylase (PgdA/CDA1 family)
MAKLERQTRGDMTTVLTLHRVVDVCRRDHDVTKDAFRRLVELLAPMPHADLRTPGPPGTVRITFDDGTDDHRWAAQELASVGLSATFFLSASLVGSPGRLDEDDIHALVAMGHGIGSHAVNHRPLRNVTLEELRLEVRGSRDRLEQISGAPVVEFAPPGGIGHPDLVPVLASEGYEACRLMRWGIYRDPGRRWAVPCVPVTEFTWRRGWVSHALMHHSLPVGMTAARLAKSALPERLARFIRTSLRERIPESKSVSND